VTHDPTFWIIARATGLVAYGLLVAVMLLGITLAGRGRPGWIRPADVTDLHRVLSLTALGMVAVHGVALVLDRAVEIPLAGLVVPGLVGYRPTAVAAGVVAGWLMVLLPLSFRLRKVIGPRVWRRFHMSSYATFALATGHGLWAGSDSGTPAGVALYALAVGLVAGATAWRVGVEKTGRGRRPAGRPAAAPAPDGGTVGT
jgi:methionine sulfoxide reductase heme-binding subunit